MGDAYSLVGSENNAGEYYLKSPSFFYLGTSVRLYEF